MNKLKNMSGQSRLAIVALILGFIAIFMNDPYSTNTAKMNEDDVASTLIKDYYKISALEISDWLIKEKQDYKLIDLRASDKYSEYFIPGALNISVDKLLSSDLLKSETLCLYSDDPIEVKKAWYLLKNQDYNSVYILDGGMKAWEDKILFPTLKKDASQEEISEFSKIASISKHFGGTPDFGGTDIKVRKRPKISPPAKVILTKNRKKKAREGC